VSGDVALWELGYLGACGRKAGVLLRLARWELN